MAGSGEEDRDETKPTSTAEDADDDSRAAAEEEDTGAEIAPIIKLDAVVVSTGEENEDALIDL
jgi:Ran-binding protein 1